MNELIQSTKILEKRVEEIKTKLEYFKDKIPPQSKIKEFIELLEIYDLYCLQNDYIRIKEELPWCRIALSRPACDINKESLKKFKKEMKKHRVYILPIGRNLCAVEFGAVFSLSEWFAYFFK